MKGAPTGGVVLGLEVEAASCTWALVRLTEQGSQVIQCGVLRARSPWSNRKPEAVEGDTRAFAEFAGLLRVVMNREHLEAVVRTMGKPTVEMGRVLGVTDAAAAEVGHLAEVDTTSAQRWARHVSETDRQRITSMLEEDDTSLRWSGSVLRAVGAVLAAGDVDELVSSVRRLRRPGPQRT